MSIQEMLITFAFEKAYPYIVEQPVIKDHLFKISFILVGSAATGLCNAESDVDICLLCDQSTYEAISVGTRWRDGRPTQVVFDGTQLHYYAISADSLDQKISEVDAIRAMFMAMRLSLMMPPGYTNSSQKKSTIRHFCPNDLKKNMKCWGAEKKHCIMS